MKKCKRQFSVKNPISTGVNSLTSSLALMAEKGRNLRDVLYTKLQECAYFCHVSREPTCVTSAYDLPAAANKICGAKQRAGAGKSWLGMQKLATPPKLMNGTEVLQRHIQHHKVSKPFGWSFSSPCLPLPEPPSTATHPAILTCPLPPLTFSSDASGRAAQLFAPYH